MGVYIVTVGDGKNEEEAVLTRNENDIPPIAYPGQYFTLLSEGGIAHLGVHMYMLPEGIQGSLSYGAEGAGGETKDVCYTTVVFRPNVQQL